MEMVSPIKFEIKAYPLLVFNLCRKAYIDNSFNLRLPIPGEEDRFFAVVGMNIHTFAVYVLDMNGETAKHLELRYSWRKQDNIEYTLEHHLFASALMKYVLDDVIDEKYKYINKKPKGDF